MTVPATQLVRDLGIPVRAAVPTGPFPGRDGFGAPCLYVVFGQESGRGLFLLQIDPQTGACRRYDAPDGFTGARSSYWSARWNRVFRAASFSELKTREGGFALRDSEAIPADTLPTPAPAPTLPDGSTFRWLDGYFQYAQLNKTIEITNPAGEKRVLHLDYEVAGYGTLSWYDPATDSFGGALIDDDYYFASGDHLRTIRVNPTQ
jgi:hypothetical protein